MGDRVSKEKSGDGENSSKQSSAASFAYKTLATTVSGGLLTLGIGVAQLKYSDHLEVLHRQGEHGVVFQERLLGMTGAIENELMLIVDLLRRSATPNERESGALLDQAKTRFDENLEPLYREWRRHRLLLRNRGAQIYGREVGEFIYSLPDEAFHVDSCNLVAHIDGAPPATDCAATMREERVFLNQFVRSIRQSGTLTTFRASERSPTSFQSNAAYARMLAHRYRVCAQARREPDRPPRCRDLASLLEIVVRRIDLVGIARENLANAILERSALRE